MFIRTDAALYKEFVESGISAARQGATLVALYNTGPRVLGMGEYCLLKHNAHNRGDKGDV